MIKKIIFIITLTFFQNNFIYSSLCKQNRNIYNPLNQRIFTQLNKYVSQFNIEKNIKQKSKQFHNLTFYNLNNQYLKRTAHHESGHATILLNKPIQSQIKLITIKPGETFLGLIQTDGPIGDNRKCIENACLISLAGGVAEQMGGFQKNKEAMVSDKLLENPDDIQKLFSQPRFFNDYQDFKNLICCMGGRYPYTNENQKLLLKKYYTKTYTLLEEYKDSVKKLDQALLEYNLLEKEEIYEILDHNIPLQLTITEEGPLNKDQKHLYEFRGFPSAYDQNTFIYSQLGTYLGHQATGNLYNKHGILDPIKHNEKKKTNKELIQDDIIIMERIKNYTQEHNNFDTYGRYIGYTEK